MPFSGLLDGGPVDRRYLCRELRHTVFEGHG
jgi:hypothetical protein